MNNSITRLKASAKTTPKNLAWAIVSALSGNSEKVEITAVGAAATNQVVKALAIARGMAITKNRDVISKTSFATLEIDSKQVTGIMFDCSFQ
ncbi:stage V sporulation protein S [Ruminococcus albus]|jgi:stage V sporulation protein S|uniref:Stage V sporulation protein S n=1 Tax=Ruminococcus albus (strain ATCC 27210 / DSM 20455 / JCM 14654 / NCDO 2250 / 7) TaxID=697329 RepID=E6UK33_RUMA7|nr:stage V sporulation protein S [Ruminococcus albus]ADU24029.1 Stage V sporulation protein S [Ruminococcus albus 7 = DSM 20455]